MKHGLYKNTANKSDIEVYFNSLSEEFIEQLKQSVIITDYIEKFIRNAVLYEFWKDNILIGLAVVYENRGIDNPAYLTNLSVSKGQTGKGVGSKLVQFMISKLKQKGFSELILEVIKDNNIALNLYAKFGFFIDSEKNSNSWLMKLYLKN